MRLEVDKAVHALPCLFLFKTSVIEVSMYRQRGRTLGVSVLMPHDRPRFPKVGNGV